MRLGDVVRVPLGNRDVHAFAVSDPYASDRRDLRAIYGTTAAPRAFTHVGLQLAQFIAEHYVTTLGEALSAVVLSAAIPRTVERLVRGSSPPKAERFRSVPPRLIALLWEDFPEAFSLEHVLRHPAARRAADRAGLLRHIGALVRSGALRRERTFVDARVHEYRIRVLEPGEADIAGPKARALASFVRAAPGVPRSDALLAGFSNAVIARAVKAGALIEREIAPEQPRERTIAAAAFVPTNEQRTALAAIARALDAGAFYEMLLQGITGSGKTFVYIEAIKPVIESGGRAIVLVPEISLTPQTAARFEAAFGRRVAVLHSALSERERYDAWQACASGDVDVVVGARSAVFAPLDRVRLLVVDEAHELSYKQETSPRYHAVTVARRRMQLEGGVLLLGSATPPLEAYDAARHGTIAHLRLDRRTGDGQLPEVHVVDMAREFDAGNRHIFCDRLVRGLGERLQLGEKTVLFVNRRGSAGFVLCRACGHVPECARCTVSLTVHRSEGLLRCHYCDAQMPLPKTCPRCGSTSIRDFGVGTERVASEVARLFPQARVVRMDSDTTTRVGDHARLLKRFEYDGDVLVGTQMVAKGLDFPQVTLVGVVAADIGLHAPDYRASERTFDLTTQVCGRSGRGRSGEAVVQTYAPDHPAIRFAAAHDYDGFAAHELLERQTAGYPPFARLGFLGVIGRNRRVVLARAAAYAERLRATTAIEVLGPAPFPVAKVNDEWRYRISLRLPRDAELPPSVRVVIEEARRDRETRLAVNVDP
ncbi:MAG: primosomal protein N' [Candidatus Eremiobacteraeota bacterium]|nr:primosomal protein N' [Candidatus Eremiobacteraeota bacterium]